MTFAARARGNPSHHRRLPALSGIALGYGDSVRLGQMPGVCGRLERKINKASVASELKLPWVCENFGHFASTSGDWRPDCGSKVRVCVCVCVCRDCDSKMRWSLCVGSQLELERWVSVYIAVPSLYTIAVQRGSSLNPNVGGCGGIGFGGVTLELPPPLSPLPPTASF